MKHKKLVSVFALIISLAMFVVALSPSAAAILEEKGNITLHVADPETGKPLVNATFRLYFVAEAYESGTGLRYELIPPYDKAGVDISDLQDSYLPVHLTYFAMSQSLPFAEKSTNENGVVEFNDLEPGLYLVVPMDDIDGYYVSSPFVIAVPEYDAQSKTWIYDIDASPKINGDFDDSGKDTYISVVKKWETDKDIPESITVVLLRNFQEYEKIQLNEENNWYYRWNNLPKDSVWSVVEVMVPDGFTVYYETSSNTVTIINKSEDEEMTTTEHSGSDDTTTTRPTGGRDDDDGGEDGDDLADTGQLNWPVPVLAIAGLLSFSIGWAILNLNKKESE